MEAPHSPQCCVRQPRNNGSAADADASQPRSTAPTPRTSPADAQLATPQLAMLASAFAFASDGEAAAQAGTVRYALSPSRPACTATCAAFSATHRSATRHGASIPAPGRAFYKKL